MAVGPHQMCRHSPQARNLPNFRLIKPSGDLADISVKLRQSHPQISKASCSQRRSFCRMASFYTAEVGFLSALPPVLSGSYRARSAFPVAAVFGSRSCCRQSLTAATKKTIVPTAVVYDHRFHHASMFSIGASAALCKRESQHDNQSADKFTSSR